jgi:hypothetical protein
MTAIQLRKRIQRRVKALSVERLRTADDFLAYLEEREDNAATRELLAIPGLLARVRKAQREAVAGKLVPFEKVRRDV